MPLRLSLARSGPARGALTLAAGALAPLGFAPLNWWPLTLLAMSAFLWLVQSARRPALCGWLFGLGFYGVGVSWVYVSIHQYGAAPLPLALLLTALFVAAIALFFALPAWLLRRLAPHPDLSSLLLFPAVWVLGEWFRSGFLTGFPWLLSGYVGLDTWLAGWAPLTGVYGISFLLALAAAALRLSLCAPQRRNLAVALLTLALIAASGFALQRIHWVKPGNGAPLKVALIQANIPQELKWLPQQQADIFQRYIAPSRQLLEQDLILWPETAIPVLLDQAAPNLAPLLSELDHHTGLISGAATRRRGPEGWHYHNSVVGLGAAEGLYHKQRLVPFGEYVPLEHWLRGLIQFFDLPMSSFSLGPADQPPLRLGNAALAPFICYEIVYPELVRRSALHSDYLLTISNDAWFGDSLAPHQHLQMARMRALENGRQLMRGTNNGISALVDERGGLIARAPQFSAAVLQGSLTPQSGTTPFTRLGSLPLWLLCALILLAGGIRRWRAHSCPADSTASR